MFRHLSFVTMMLIACSVIANDGAARIRSSGLEFVKNDDIRIIQEILEISADRIKVDYRFKNESNRDVRTTIAFPMPPYYLKGDGGYQANTAYGPAKNFRTQVNGNQISMKLMQRAFFAGREITDQLRQVGLTDREIFNVAFLSRYPGMDIPCYFIDGDKADYSLAPTKKSDLVKLKLLTEEFCPTWQVSDVYYWEQNFLAGKEVVINHEYEYSSYAGSRYHPNLYPAERMQLPVAAETDEACLDEGTGQAIKNQIKTYIDRGADSAFVQLRDVEYVLETGRAWKGPIGEFRLRLKLDPPEKTGLANSNQPDQFVSLCFPGIPNRVDKTTLEFVERNYIAQDKLVVYFYSLVPNKRIQQMP